MQIKTILFIKSFFFLIDEPYTLFSLYFMYYLYTIIFDMFCISCEKYFNLTFKEMWAASQ